jgi:hypothetical protein
MSDTSATLLERLSDRSDSIAWRRLVDLYSPLIKAFAGVPGASIAVQNALNSCRTRRRAGFELREGDRRCSAQV